MISVTASAVEHLRELLAAESAPPGKGLRISVAKGGCSGLQYDMAIATGEADDVTVLDGEAPLYLDPASIAHLRGSTLDYEDGLAGAGFRIMNPNAVRTCGCGTSFEPAKDGVSAA